MSAVFLVKLRELEQRIEALEQLVLQIHKRTMAEVPEVPIIPKRGPGRPRKEAVSG